jgi:hypothetical protein
MHALHRVGSEIREARYQAWAAELAVCAHQAFTRQSHSGGPKRMIWKMSIDLARPLVPSMGQHDPLDGLITCLELQSATGFRAEPAADLSPAIADYSEMCAFGNYVTNDVVGIGGILDGASRLAQLVFNRGIERRGLLRQILIDAEISMSAIGRSGLLEESADRRLPFRELGLSIGIHALEWVRGIVAGDREVSAIIASLLTYRSIAEQIEEFWSHAARWNGSTWTDHRDINTVMLATSLAPEGYVQI